MFSFTAYNRLAQYPDKNRVNCLQAVDSARALKLCTNIISAACGYTYYSMFNRK